jgi:hypothetical protein
VYNVAGGGLRREEWRREREREREKKKSDETI